MTAEPGPQRIAIIVDSMKSGGAQRVALNLAAEFGRRGIAVDLVLVSEEGPLLEEVPAAVRIVALGSRRARGAILALRRYIRREKPTTVIAIAFHINVLAALAMVGLKSRPQLILTVHSTFSRAIRDNPAAARLWLKPATALLYPRADRIVAASHDAAADLAREARLDPKWIVTIHNPVIGDDFEKKAAQAPGHPWARDRARKLVVSVGRLTHAKDHAALLRAFATVAAQTDARLLILGEGRLRPELEAMIASLGLEESVALAGFVGNPLPAMKAADVFVLSSRWEGFGNVLVEAMATGTAVVSTDCPSGPREILEGGKWGKLVPVVDERALADAISAVLRDGGIDARSRAADFSVEIAADKYLALIGAL